MWLYFRFAVCVLMLFACSSAFAQGFEVEQVPAQGPVPAPALEWGEWKQAGTCGGATYYVATTKDDGRNDFEVKLKVENTGGNRIATRFKADARSAENGKAHREGGSTIAPGKTAEGSSLSFGVLFQSAVNQLIPTGLGDMTLKVDVANLDAPPPNTPPSAYLSPFLDYPVTSCDLKVNLAGSKSKLKFESLTDSCVNNLPKWTPPCDDAVQEISPAYNQAPASVKPCILEWRNYQKCYEIYAFDSSPNPRPRCERPRCILDLK